MDWLLNKLEKTTEVTITPGSPAVPASPGTAGSPAYSYLQPTTVPGQTYVSSSPPSGWDNETTISIPGGGTQTIQSGGYRYFGGVKAYLSAILFGVEYIYKSPSQTIQVRVYVDAVPPVPATPGVPATLAERIEEYNFGWNSGAHGPATDLAVNEAFSFKMSAGNVGAIVGLTLSVDPQDNGYTGMQIAVMGQSGQYQIYRNGIPITSLAPYVSGDRWVFSRTNIGTIEIYKSGALVHTESLAADVVPDASLYSGGDVIWDAQVQATELAPILSEIQATTISDAQAALGLVTATPTFGPGTARGVAGATTQSKGFNGAVVVNGSVTVGVMSGSTVTAAVGDDQNIGATKTFGTGTALGTMGAETLTAADAVGDPLTGVGVSTNVGAGDPAMLPLTAAGAAPNVYTGWTGNFQGDSLNMEEMTFEGSGGLAAPVIGTGYCIMPPMDASVTGLTGETTIDGDMSMQWLSMFASSETTYSQAQGYMHPLTVLASDEDAEDFPQLNEINVTEEFTIASPTMVNFVNEVIEPIEIGTTVQTFYNPTVDLAEEVLATTYQCTAFVLQVAEQFNVSDEISATQVVAIAEALLMTGSVQTMYQGVVAVLASMTIEDAVIPAYATTVSDNILLTDATLETILRVASIIESMTIATTMQNTLTVIVEETLNATIADNIELTAQYLVDVLEHADVYAMLKTPSELAQGWVMNTEGTQPVSEYNNYNFNSMDWHEGVMYGCNDDGLYKMGADDDAGEPITAEISSMMLDMGTSRMKRIRSAYLGYTSTNELVMKVMSVSQGQLSEHWYKASRTATADAPDGSYMAVGQGLKSRYWQFELTNIDGGDFEIDLVELHPLVLNRRV